MKNLPSDFGIKEATSTFERRPNGTRESGSKKPGGGPPPKGTYGRHSAFRDGDCFRGFVSCRESATGTAKDATRIEGF